MGGSGNYVAPANVPVSCNWKCHKNRPNGGSPEPGTDYATAYGTDLAMAGDGTVAIVDNSASGGEGRRLSINLADGRRVDYIHLSRIRVKVGERVKRGQKGVCNSGASGYGNDWYYGAHVHVSLWERPGMPYRDTIDFEKYVGTPAPPAKGDTVIAYHYQDKDARAKGRNISPGNGLYLNINSGADNSKASNVVGGVGPYSLTAHVYAEGKPGDIVEALYLWDDTKTSGAHSPHYTETIVIPDEGFVKRSVEFKRAVASGFAVYLRVQAPKTNSANVKITVLDSDAYLFV